MRSKEAAVYTYFIKISQENSCVGVGNPCRNGMMRKI